MIGPVVFIDPFELATGVGFVIVRFPTGVTYQQQYGGTACMQGLVEGYLVPIDITSARGLLEDLFIGRLQGAGLGGSAPRAPGILAAIEDALALVGMQRSDAEHTEAPLLLDPQRVDEVDEAWLPVSTPDGPGVLVWLNSD
jgi:Family of unknown function (DUF6210)